MCAGGRVPSVVESATFLGSAYQKKNTAGLRDATGLRLLFVFVVSSGDICGKKTNPCGEDAICNQTNVNSICQCKAGFQRNQKSGQCEGDSSSFFDDCRSSTQFNFPHMRHVRLSMNRFMITFTAAMKKTLTSGSFYVQSQFVAINLV